MFVFGTRPEAIKMAPIILEAKRNSLRWDTKVVLSGQHKEMVEQILNFFQITPDYDLDIMKASQTLFDITGETLRLLQPILENEKPDVVLVQGDTSTAFISSLASFYYKLPVAHIEAGLRSGDNYSPFPEEINRKLISNIAELHFAPTEEAKLNLTKEGILNNVFCVGNTVIDALKATVDLVVNDTIYRDHFSFLDPRKRLIFVTAHRRESFGKPLEAICNAILELVSRYEDIEVVFPVHPNPQVLNTVYPILNHVPRIHLIKPLDYPYLIWLLNQSYIVLSDSGGIQEEAPTLGKPVLVLREVTERVEGIAAGTAKLVGQDLTKIVDEVSLLLDEINEYELMARSINPYGDGTSSVQILELIDGFLDKE